MKAATKIRLNSKTHSVRASQAVLQYGVGAMVDFPSQTLMTAAPEFWEQEVRKVHDERLEKALGVDWFGMPAGEEGGKSKNGISYARFPEWYFCPKCRKFQPLKKWIEERGRKAKANDSDPDMVRSLRCPADNQELVVARIITICEHGHIDDFPWIKWVHRMNISGPVKICEKPDLRFMTSPVASEGLEGLTIKCEACKARTTLNHAFDKDEFVRLDADERVRFGYSFECTGRHPWKNTAEKCGLYPKVQQRGSSSVYFPVIASSLVIPPYSAKLTAEIENSRAFETCRIQMETIFKCSMTQDNREIHEREILKSAAHDISMEIGCPNEGQVLEILERKRTGEENMDFDTAGLRYRAEEYDALSGRTVLEMKEYDDFVREDTDISEYGIPFVKSISLIHKIREVQALLGFSRINPFQASAIKDGSLNFVSVKEPETRWYPGYNVYGEGIFIEFNEDAINVWRNKNMALRERVTLLQRNYDDSFISRGNPRTLTEKLLLLHTVSHLLIKELSFECGYSIASLKERLYCGELADGKAMSGILIYTASGDSEGTLGGLVRQGYADTFPGIYRKAIQSALTCSNDPVCSLSEGQGRDSLNLAACYSCCLLPETSCEEYNVFLDRGVVIGTVKNRGLGFFHDQVYGVRRLTFGEKPNMQEISDQKKVSQLIVTKAGTDLSEEDYCVIWKSMEMLTDTPEEIEMLEYLLSEENMDLKEKPYRDTEFVIVGDDNFYVCSLWWRNTEMMYFSSELKEDYDAACRAGYSALYGAGANPQKTAEELKERLKHGNNDT